MAMYKMYECKRHTKYGLTLTGTRHFVILHGTGGGDATPRVWLLTELEL